MDTLRTLLACLALTGCVADVDPEVDEPTELVDDSDPGTPGGYAHGGGHNTGCGYDVITLETPDGERIDYVYPLECDPYWMYHTPPGDPPPEEMSDHDEVSLPSPEAQHKQQNY